jgi:glucans biosynthesis protein
MRALGLASRATTFQIAAIEVFAAKGGRLASRQFSHGDRSGQVPHAPDARSPQRCRLHGGAPGSGAPSGKRNGQYLHGERTKGAIAERRKFPALLKALRAGL